MAHDREVAGLRCLQVLEGLSDYLDDELDAGTRAQVDAHLAGCDWCERFGGRMAGVIGDLRRGLSAPEPLGIDVRQRLLRRLEVE